MKGFSLPIVLMLLGVVAGLIAAFVSTTETDLKSTRFSRNTVSGFYAAEGGLNLRAQTIRTTFQGYNVPSGTSPSATNPCVGTNMGDGDYACQRYTINNREVRTYVIEDPDNPSILTIPPGERYQNLNAQEFRYTARSEAINSGSNDTEALLELRFKSRLVPLFQFAAFYNKDLEILPGPTMVLSGPVHANGDLYLLSDGNSLTIQGQVTTSGRLFRGRKNTNACNNSPVRIYNPTNPVSLIPTCPTRTEVQSSQLGPWNGMIQIGVPKVTVPEPEVFDPIPSSIYWQKADLRVILRVDGSNNPIATQPIQVVDMNYVVDSVGTAALTNSAICPVRPGETLSTTPVSTRQMYNYREGAWIRLLDVDMGALFDCLHQTNWFNTNRPLNENSEGGLVFHFTVIGPNSAPVDNDNDGRPDTPNRYGVRVYNGANLGSIIAGSPKPLGVTVVTDQAMYVMGDYNSVAKIPAAIMADSLNVLSNNWNRVDANTSISGFQFHDDLTNCSFNSPIQRQASNTTINAAFLAGTDSTGNIDGVGGQGGSYNGGLENYPRFHEKWTGATLTYRGSFVSLGKPRRVRSLWASQCYTPPIRNWNYDVSFNNAANLPPITPRFVYLRQELFVRDFER